MEEKMKNEIPKWGWYNGLFMFEFYDALQCKGFQDIVNFYDSFRKRNLNGIEFPLKNQGLSISLLFMLLVIPRELWENEQNKGTRFDFKTRCYFSFQEGENFDTWDFLRCMRNSVSHANFDMNKDGEYTFWNEQNNGNINFKVSIMHSKLFLFITEIGKYYINKIKVQKNKS